MLESLLKNILHYLKTCGSFRMRIVDVKAMQIWSILINVAFLGTLRE